MPKVSEASARTQVKEIRTYEVPAQEENESAKEKLKLTDELTFWQKLNELTEADWQEYIVYLYREEPKSSRTPKYLEVLTQSFTPDYIKEKYGGNLFKAMLLKGDKLQATTYISIEAPPKLLDDVQSATAGGNGGDVVNRLLSVLQQNLSDMREELKAARAEGRQVDPYVAVQEVAQVMRKASDTAMEIVLKQSTGEGRGESSIMQLFLKSMVDRLLNPPDPMKTVETMLGVIDKLRAETPSGEASDWKAELARGVAGKADVILDRASQLMADYRASQEAITARMLAAQGYPVRLGPARPGPAAAAPIATAARPASAATVEQPAAAPGQQPMTPQEALRNFWKLKLVELLFAGETGDRAADVIDALETKFAQEIAQTLKTNPLSLYDDPILVKATDHPNCRQFAQDFVAYFEEEPEPVAAGGGDKQES